jgi:hypothetical protein
VSAGRRVSSGQDFRNSCGKDCPNEPGAFPSFSVASTRPCEPRRRPYPPPSSGRLRKLSWFNSRSSCGVHARSATMAHLREPRMGNLLFLRRSYAYRHAAAAAFRNARALPIGSERNVQRVLGRALSELARTEAWLEGQRCHHPQFLRTHLHAGVGG